ncbi:MAG: DUF2294 domain-containing protein [Solirubrobacterales bacterium]|jgi:uncharacterized protein YbcI|nr:DUF2294 domain-containing protein [Solirubrobacterales bacterium]
MSEQNDPGPAQRRSPHAEISNQISRIQSTYYGKGPLRAKTYMQDDLVCCVLEETFTRAEKTLIRRGERESIQRIRRQFQEAVKEEFIGVVEQVTGRKVRAFMSDTDVDNDISVETFLMAEDRTSMEKFEKDAKQTD